MELLDQNGAFTGELKSVKDAVGGAFWKEKTVWDYGLERAIVRFLASAEFRSRIDTPSNRATKQPSQGEFLQNISHLTCKILENVKEDGNRLYSAIAQKFFFRSAGKRNGSNRIITFNYDNLMDGHLLSSNSICGIDEGKLYFDCGHKHPVIVKLHGSINWWCPSSDVKSILEGTFNGHIAPKCQHANGMEALIIPPLPNKPVTSVPFFLALWTKAFEYLSEAKHIVICGYSLPETDELAETMYYKFRNNKVETVTLIDPSPQVRDKWISLFRHKDKINPRVKIIVYRAFLEGSR